MKGRGFPGGSVVKNSPANTGDKETQVWSLGWEDPLEKEMATHSSILAWKIPWTERSLASHNPWGHKELDTIEHTHMHLHNGRKGFENTLKHSLKVKGVRCLPPTPKICIAQLDTANGSAIILSGKAIMAVFMGHNHLTDASFFYFALTRNQTYIPCTESVGS